MKIEPAHDVLAFVRDVVGDMSVVHDLSHDHELSSVYEVCSLDGRHFVLKHHHHPRRFVQEVEFYRRFTLPLAGKVADLVAVSDEPLCAIVMTRLDGSPCEPERLSHEAFETISFQAGRLLRALHEQEGFGDIDELPIADAISQRMHTAIEQASDVLDPSVIERIHTVAGDMSCFVDEQRVPCHRDFIPRNWLFTALPDSTSELSGLIDFDQSRPDARLWDFVRFKQEYATESPAAWRALQAGYGAEFNERAVQQLQILSVLNALGTILWSNSRGDAPFEEQGRQWLDQALHSFC